MHPKFPSWPCGWALRDKDEDNKLFLPQDVSSSPIIHHIYIYILYFIYTQPCTIVCIWQIIETKKRSRAISRRPESPHDELAVADMHYFSQELKQKRFLIWLHGFQGTTSISFMIIYIYIYTHIPFFKYFSYPSVTLQLQTELTMINGWVLGRQAVYIYKQHTIHT